MAVRGVESSLNDPKYIKAVEKQIEEILNRQDAVESKVDATSRAPRTVSDTPDVDISGTALPDGGVNPTRRFTPAAPAGLNAATAISFNNGLPFVSISIGYERVTNALAGDPITVARHELQGRKASGEWATLTSSGGSATVVNYSPLPTGEAWEFRMRAVSAQGISGPYSEILAVMLPADTTPPPVPSTPALSTRLGTVSVSWDGLTATGTGMPSDFARIDVQQGSNNVDFATVGSIRGGGGAAVYIATGLPYNNSFYYRFVAVDNSGNMSTPGASAYITVLPLVDTDIIGAVISGANIVPGSINAADSIIGNTITGDLIQALTIKAGHLDSNSVTTDKLEAGSITGIKIAANTISTNNMFIGDYQNLAPTPDSPDWSALGAWSVVPSTPSATGKALWIPGNLGTGNNDRGGAYFDTAPGESFSVEATITYVGTLANNGTVRVGVQWLNTAGASISWDTPISVASTATALVTTRTVVAPAGAAKVRFWTGRVPPTGAGSSSSYSAIWNYSLRRMTTGSLIVDGAIDGKTITGAIVRTSASGARVQIDSSGLHAFNSGGTEVTTISASTGQVTALGSFSTGTSGQRVSMSGSGIDFYPPSGSFGASMSSTSGSESAGGTLSLVGVGGGSPRLVIGRSQGIINASVIIDMADTANTGGLVVQDIVLGNNSTGTRIPRIRTGTGQIANIAANAGQSITVTFPTGAFSATPNAVIGLGPIAQYMGGGIMASVWSISATSMVIGISNPTATARTVPFTWAAFGN